MEIAIVGAGFSGSLLALQVLRADADARVYLIERASQFGRGLAYGTAGPEHLLNIRAANMSAFVEDPSHFVDWLRSTTPDEAVTPGFVSRHLYGTYLQALLGTAMQTAHGAGRLIAIADEVVALSGDGVRPRLRFALGHTLEADYVVLATGNLPPHDLPPFAGADPTIYTSDPWAGETLADVGNDDDVLLLGTGLTAVDMVLRLTSGGHAGSIRALSRRGLRPHRHENDAPSMASWPVPLQPSLTELLRRVRATAATMGWREAVDGLRPSVQRLWRDAPLQDRRRFLRHLRPWWDIHRHRIAPEVAATLDRLEAEGRLGFLAGRVEDVRFERTGGYVGWSPRGKAERHEMHARHIINCTGPAGALAKCRSPLLRSLLDGGFARPDACGLGLDVDEACRLIDGQGRRQDRLLAVGPSSRGAFWEITSVPDIRVQAAQVARSLTESR